MHVMVQANACIYVPASCLNMVRTYSSMYTSFQYYECCMLIYIIIIVVMVIPCLRALFYANVKVCVVMLVVVGKFVSGARI